LPPFERKIDQISKISGPNKYLFQHPICRLPFFSSFPGPILDFLSLLEQRSCLPKVHRRFCIILSRIYSPSLRNHSLAIREYDAKLLLAYWLERAPPADPSAKVATNFIYPSPKVAQVSWDAGTNTITPDTQLPSWVFTSKLVAKPDQLIKRRGKAGLLALNKTWEEAKEWIAARAGKPQKVSSTFSTLHLYLGSVAIVGTRPRPRPLLDQCQLLGDLLLGRLISLIFDVTSRAFTCGDDCPRFRVSHSNVTEMGGQVVLVVSVRASAYAHVTFNIPVPHVPISIFGRCELIGDSTLRSNQ
jgi:hypothetical protein